MRKAFTLIETLVVIAIVAVLLALLVPAVMRVRETAQLLHSENNIKQLCLGLQNLADSNDGRLPGAIWSDAPYKAETFVELLPYLEEQHRYDRIVNQVTQLPPLGIFQMRVHVFLNPLDPSMSLPNPTIDSGMNLSMLSVSSYALNAQFFSYYPRLSGITDGLSQTIWLAEHYGWNCNQTTFLYTIGTSNRWTPFQPATFAQGGAAVGAATRGDYFPITVGAPPVSNSLDGRTFQTRPKLGDCDPRMPNASLSRGLQVGMADGSVHILHPAINPHTFWGMVTPCGGEVIDDATN